MAKRVMTIVIVTVVIAAGPDGGNDGQGDAQGTRLMRMVMLVLVDMFPR